MLAMMLNDLNNLIFERHKPTSLFLESYSNAACLISKLCHPLMLYGENDQLIVECPIYQAFWRKPFEYSPEHSAKAHSISIQ